MLSRRITYAVLLFFAVMFYILYDGAISFYCLLFCVTVPLISLLLTLPLGRRPNVQLRLPSRVKAGEKTALCIRIGRKRLIPVACISVYIGMENEMTGYVKEVSRYDVFGCREYADSFPIPTDDCGRIRCDIPKVIIYDYTGIFRRVCNIRSSAFVNVMPVPMPIMPRPVIPLGELKGIVYRPKRGGGFAEDYDIRNYRIGDPVNLIHWKMTAKRDIPMVREPLVSEHGKACISIDMFGDVKTVCRTLSRLYWLLMCLISYRVDPFVRWRDPITNEDHISEIKSKTDIRLLLEELLCTRITEPGETLEGKSKEGFAWTYHISGKAGVIE